MEDEDLSIEQLLDERDKAQKEYHDAPEESSFRYYQTLIYWKDRLQRAIHDSWPCVVVPRASGEFPDELIHWLKARMNKRDYHVWFAHPQGTAIYLRNPDDALLLKLTMGGDNG